MKIISNPVNGIDHLLLELKKKRRKKEDFVLWSKYFKREEIWKIPGVG